MKYFILYEEKRKGSHFYLIDLKDGFLYKAKKPFAIENNFCEGPPEDFSKPARYLRAFSSELDSYNLKTGINKFISTLSISEKILEKIKTARYVTPRVHKLDYLGDTLTKKEIKEIKEKVRDNTLVDFSQFSFPFLKRISSALLSNYEINNRNYNEKLVRFLFPIIN